MNQHPFLPELGRALVLASRSPRRSEILSRHGLDFEVLPAEIEEVRVDGESLEHFVPRLARDKAQAVSHLRPEAVCLGCDTVVVLRGEVLGKPRGEADAVRMLEMLSGEEHSVISAIALVCHELDFLSAQFERTRVLFHSHPRETLERYVATGEPMDKAGAYGIQGHGAMLVKSIEGSYFTVMGLPLDALREVWLEFVEYEEKRR